MTFELELKELKNIMQGPTLEPTPWKLNNEARKVCTMSSNEDVWISDEENDIEYVLSPQFSPKT